MDYGIKISLPGKDVKSVGIKDLILSSKYPLLKMVAYGSGSLSYTDGGAGFDVLLYTHNLGYNPTWLLYSQYYDSLANTLVTSFEKMPYAVRNASFSQEFRFIPTVSTTEFRYTGSSFGGSGGSKTISYYWFLYYEPE